MGQKNRSKQLVEPVIEQAELMQQIKAVLMGVMGRTQAARPSALISSLAWLLKALLTNFRGLRR
jgi:hypothetical protein